LVNNKHGCSKHAYSEPNLSKSIKWDKRSYIVLKRTSYGEEEKGNQTQPFLRARIT